MTNNPFEEKPPQPNDSPEDKEKLSKRILVADDEPAIRDIFVMALASRGYLVDTVENGQALLNRLLTGKEKYDLVITDNNMPLMTGIQALQRIRTNDRFKDLPVIVCTGIPDTEKERIVKEAGGEFLQKPVSIDDLRIAVEKMLAESKE